jgi:hypothetical protein
VLAAATYGEPRTLDTVTAEQLVAFLRAERAHVLPLIGSGMTVAAGAPSTTALARELARRCCVSVPADTSLVDITHAAEAALGAATVQEHLAEMVTGWRLHPTPALRALCAVPTGRVMTTNYDDGIERSARSRGIDPVPLLPTDPRMLQPPGDKELQVVHLHGMPVDPGTLVLPGRGMSELELNDVFTRFMSATMASSNVLYLGFSFAAAERHLMSILTWLSENVEACSQHYLLLAEQEIRDRSDEMEMFSKLGFVTIVGYESDRRHAMVERVTLALAPRAESRSDEPRGSREVPTTLQPILVQSATDEDHEQLQQKISGFDYGWSGSESITTPEAMIGVGRSLLIAGPGMGKTTFVEWLPTLTSSPCARGSLKGFAPGRDDAPPEDAIARILDTGDGLIAREDLDGVEYALGIDGLDEVEDHLRDQAAAAVVAAVTRWPTHKWVVTSRPCAELQAFMEVEFASFHILPSRRWAKQYLEMRSVPQDRVERAMLDGYGLGDLLGIPLFAERLADRLLDDRDEDLSPLQLLVEEQYAATAKEARRTGQRRADLGKWMRMLAVAVELRGRSSAQVAELAQILGPDGLGGEQAQTRLVNATLLADIPGIAAFPLKTLQEGLCADAILKSADPVTVLRHVVCAEVAGVERLREDIELTIDLVFEDADKGVRTALRTLDEQRWARTVMTRGTMQDAREALEILHSAHVQRGVAYGLFGDGALRSSRQAVAAIARRWPKLIHERRGQLEEEARSPTPADRLRALETLGQLAEDEYTDDWLLPRLHDPDPLVAAQAAAIAGRLRLSSAESTLRTLQESKNDRVRKSALAALVEIVDLEALPHIAGQVASGNDLQSVAERLLENLDLDHGIQLVHGPGQIDGALPSIMEQLIKTAHPDAWTPTRVGALALACAHMSGRGIPDTQMLADIFAQHPDEAIKAVRVHKMPDGLWGPAGQLLPLSRLDPVLLAGDEHAELREAIDRAVREHRRYEDGQNRHAMEMDRFLAVLDEKGAAALPEDVDVPAGSLHMLTGRYREIATELVARWWPATGLGPAAPEQDLDERTRSTLILGSSARATLTDEHWTELLDAHLAARRFGEPELTENNVVAWLADTYNDRREQTLLERFAHDPDATAVSKLVAIAGRLGRSGEVAHAALGRLAELGPESPGWLNAIGLLAEGGNAAQIRALIDAEMAADKRLAVISTLATHGDEQSQLETLQALTAAVQGGHQTERPHWPSSSVRSPGLLAAAAELANTALTAGAEDLAGFALAQIQAHPDEEALAVLAGVVNAHHGDRPWLAAGLEQMSRRIATQRVLLRLPEALHEVAADFERVAGRT